MIETDELLEKARRIIQYIERRYRGHATDIERLVYYEFANTGRVRQNFGSGHMKLLETFSEFDKDRVPNPLMDSLDRATMALKKRGSSMPENDRQMRMALTTMARWSALANLGYERGEAERKTLRLVGDFCADYNSMSGRAVLFSLLCQQTS